MQITKSTRPNAEVALSGVLLSPDIEKFWDKALVSVTREVSLPGFRKGHVPRERVLAEVGEKSLWREAAEMTLKDQLETVMKDNEVIPIAPLSLSMKPGEKGSDVPFEIVAVVAPTVVVGDYKVVAERALSGLPKEDAAKEVEEATKAFRGQIASFGGNEDPKKIGFETSEALDVFINDEAQKVVQNRAMQRRRSAIAEALIKAYPAEIPTILVGEEARALLHAMKKDIAAQGLAWNDYLKKVKKTEEMIMADMLPAAQKRIALDLIFGAIIKKEGLTLAGEEDKKREDEIAHAVAKQGAPHDRAHTYARETMLREKVWGLWSAT